MSFVAGCGTSTGNSSDVIDREPVIEPDYSGVTIPQNIAPMNFKIIEDGSDFIINVTSSNGESLTIKSADGIVKFPERSWEKLLRSCQGGKIGIEVVAEDNTNLLKYRPITFHVAHEPIDPYLCYRLLFPGYETWYEIKIVQRDIESFNEESLVENRLLDNNCVNCHSFNQNSPERFLLHIRGSVGGTYIIDRDRIERADLQTAEMTSGAVYPAWHPGGRFVAFSSNDVKQSFHSVPEKNIQVFDLASSLVLYDTEKNEMIPIQEIDTTGYMETFPEWSPDGNYLYYCRAIQYIEGSDFREVKYDLVRKAFNRSSRSFGTSEIVFDAKSINQSVSFPRISPDGRFLVFTLHEYGTFSIWHREADLYILDLLNGQHKLLSLNSSESESYHTWSSNSKWMVFSSKRGDGLTARPYIAYMGSPDHIGKPFVLPQKDPTLYNRMLKTFNKPEFVSGKINIGPRDFARAAKQEALMPGWVEENQVR